MIDLRSDTVTTPTSAMRQAMASAEVGDDVADFDPTIRELEQRTAELLGKEAAVYMSSGTQTNQIALRCHCSPGDEFLCEAATHIVNYEQGAFAQLSGLVARTIHGDDGIMRLDQMQGLIRPENEHFTRTRLVTIENTHNRAAGRVLPFNEVKAICDWAAENGLARHLDGARLWNAVVASGVSENQWASLFDSVSVCFSKGLGAPVGSCLVGSSDFIQKARRARKLFGGAMRQAGIIAAGALYALDNNRARLEEDHQHASMLAEAVAGTELLRLQPEIVETNIVVFNVPPAWGTAAKFVQGLADADVAVLAIAPQTIRMVTHLDVDRSGIEAACRAIQHVASEHGMSVTS